MNNKIYMTSNFKMFIKTRTRLPFDNSYKCVKCGSRFDATIRGNTIHCDIQAKKTYSFINSSKYI